VPETDGVPEHLAAALPGATGGFVKPLHLDLLELDEEIGGCDLCDGAIAEGGKMNVSSIHSRHLGALAP